MPAVDVETAFTESSHKGLGNSETSEVSLLSFRDVRSIQEYFESSVSEIILRRPVWRTENQAQFDSGGHGIAAVCISICTSFAYPWIHSAPM